jgi:hypothetical protein
MVAIRSPDMSVLTRLTRRHIPQDEILTSQMLTAELQLPVAARMHCALATQRFAFEIDLSVRWEASLLIAGRDCLATPCGTCAGRLASYSQHSRSFFTAHCSNPPPFKFLPITHKTNLKKGIRSVLIQRKDG